MNPKEAEKFIEEAFEENYELLRSETGHNLTPDMKRQALDQVKYYWRKLRDLAEKITDTEVKLSLPERRTPKGSRFAIEGIVDIVREGEETWMYDIKAHDPDFVRGNLDLYEQQLNIYAYIWQELRRHDLTGTAVIATAPNDTLKRAIRSGNPEEIETAIATWEPVIRVEFAQENIDDTVRDFGEVVDCIESKAFAPPPLRKLKTPVSKARKTPFGTDVCRNCDGRFSCDSYRKFYKSGRRLKDIAIRFYVDDVEDTDEQASWLEGNLDTAE